MRDLNYALTVTEKVHHLKPLAAPWIEIVNLLSQPPEVAADRSQWLSKSVEGNIHRCFCPTHFKPLNDPTAFRPKGVYSRANANSLGKDLLVLDIDNAPDRKQPKLGLEEALQHFAGFEFLLYTSYNHQNPEKHGGVDKFRIVLPLASYCTVDEWSHRKAAMVALWPFADIASFTPSQLFFLPVVHPDRKDEFRLHHNVGKWFDWQELSTEPANVSGPNFQQPDLKGRGKTVAKAIPMVLEDGRHTTTHELYDELEHGYDHRVRCFSPYRPDNKPGCYAYRYGPFVVIFDNTEGQRWERVVEAPPTDDDMDPQPIIDFFKRMEERKQLEGKPPEPSPIVELDDPEPVIVKVDCRYLKDENREGDKLYVPTKGLVFIRSPKGTGKTEFLQRLIGESPDRILLLGHRVTLLRGLAKRLEVYDYQTKSGLPDQLAISLDSLASRFSSAASIYDKPYTTIIIDESEQVLRHLTSDTLKRRRNDVFNTLIRLIRAANRVICLDADLTGILSIEVIAKLRGRELLEKDELVGYLNVYKYSDREISIFPSKPQLVADLVEALKARQKVFVASNTLAFTETLAEIVKTYWPEARYLSVTALTKDDIEVMEFINRPNDKVGLYDVLVASPSMSTGISIDEPFDAVYGFFTQMPLTYQDCDQAISRVRNSAVTKVWVQAVDHKSPPPSELYHYHQTKQREITTRIRLPDESPELTQGEELWLRIFSRLNWLEGRWMHDKRANFIELKREAGYNVIEIPEDEDSKEEGQTILESIATSLVDKQVAEIVFLGEDIGPGTADDLQSKQVKTRAEQVALTRYYYRKLIGDMELTFDVVKRILTKKLLERHNWIRFALGQVDNLIVEDQWERQNAKRAFTDNQHRTKTVELFRELCDVASISYVGLLHRSKAMHLAKVKLAAAEEFSKPRSKHRREAHSDFNAQAQQINIEISDAVLLAVATHYGSKIQDYNLYFDARIYDPTNERSQLKAWNATFGLFGIPVRKMKRGPRGEQEVYYELDCSANGLLWELMELPTKDVPQQVNSTQPKKMPSANKSLTGPQAQSVKHRIAKTLGVSVSELQAKKIQES